MKSLIVLALLCSSQVFASVSMEIPRSVNVIPAVATSCLAMKEGKENGHMPAQDIPASYFRISKMKISNASEQTLFLSYVKITFNPGTGSNIECSVGGDYLTASIPESIEPNSVGTLTCPIYCGGLSLKPGTYAAKMEVYGLHLDKNGVDQTPVKMTQEFEVQQIY